MDDRSEMRKHIQFYNLGKEAFARGIFNYEWLINNADYVLNDRSRMFLFTEKPVGENKMYNPEIFNIDSYILVWKKEVMDNTYELFYIENNVIIFSFSFSPKSSYMINEAIEIMREMKEFMYDLFQIRKKFNQKLLCHMTIFLHEMAQNSLNCNSGAEYTDIFTEMDRDMVFSIKVNLKNPELVNDIMSFYEKYKDSGRMKEPVIETEKQWFMHSFGAEYNQDYLMSKIRKMIATK